MESRALGKGLSALIPEKTESSKAETVSQIKAIDIKLNSLQPRKHYDDEKLLELIDSIKEKGVLQPILVRRKEWSYEVVAGERRLRAAHKLGMETIPVVVKDVSDQEALVIALVENIQREELNAIEEAQAFRKLIDEFNFTQDQVAKSVGKDRSTISNTLRLLKLPEKIQEGISKGTISEGHARAVLSLVDRNEQMKLFERIVRNGISVREAEAFVLKDRPASTRKKLSKAAARDHNVVVLEESLQTILGTKVRILAKKKRGKIIIDYYSNEDLDRIIGVIKK